jgi:outer membrane protein TolC
MNHINFNEHGQAAMFAVTVPVFDWFRTRNLAAQSSIRAGQLATQARIAQRTYSRDYQNALARLSTLYQQISFTQQQIAVAEDNLRLSQLKYQGGEGLPLEVLTAQTQVGQARSAYFTALASYHVAQADLEVAAAQ